MGVKADREVRELTFPHWSVASRCRLFKQLFLIKKKMQVCLYVYAHECISHALILVIDVKRIK